MKRTQIQFPDPLYRRLKEIAEMNDWSLADVVRRGLELYVVRFPESARVRENWVFPTLDMGGDFVTDPADIDVEAEAIARRSE